MKSTIFTNDTEQILRYVTVKLSWPIKLRKFLWSFFNFWKLDMIWWKIWIFQASIYPDFPSKSCQLSNFEVIEVKKLNKYGTSFRNVYKPTRLPSGLNHKQGSASDSYILLARNSTDQIQLEFLDSILDQLIWDWRASDCLILLLQLNGL